MSFGHRRRLPLGSMRRGDRDGGRLLRPVLHCRGVCFPHDPEGPVEVWLVDGNLVRSYYKIDYTEGGHGYVYPWVPRSEIWIEDGVDRREVPFIVSHEYIERRLMRDQGIDYNTAHAICSRLEFDLRKGKGLLKTPYLGSEQRKLMKKDLVRLTSDEVFRFVLRHYVKK